MRHYTYARIDKELVKLLYSINLNRAIKRKRALSMRYFTYVLALNYNRDWKRVNDDFIDKL